MIGKTFSTAIIAFILAIGCTPTSSSNDEPTNNADDGGAVANSNDEVETPGTDDSNNFSLASFEGTVNQNSISVTFTLGPNASSFATVRLTRVQGSSAPANCDVGTVLSTINSPVDNAVLIITDSGLRVATNYAYRVCYSEAGSTALVSADNLTLTGLKTDIIQPFCDAPPCAAPKGGSSDRTFTLSSINDSKDNTYVEINDMNGDGEPDLILSFVATNTVIDDETPVEVWLKSGANWALESTVGKDSDDTNSSAIGTADLDNDNQIDLVVAPWLGNVDNLVHWGDGAGAFSGNFAIGDTNHTASRKIYFADLNGNGILDVIGANDGNFQVMINDTDKTFSNALGYGTGNSSRLILDDFDNDGDVDVIRSVFNSASASGLKLHKNNGSGGFDTSGTDLEASPTATTGSQCSAGGDIDNDGDIDIFFTENSAKARVLESNGDGTFGNSTELSADAAPNQFYGDCALADLDGDDYLDFIMSSEVELSVIWGDGTFNPSVRQVLWTRPGSEQLWGFAVGDLNGDSILDIVGAIKLDSQDDIILYGDAP